MSASKRFAAAASLAVVSLALIVATACAQGSGPSPSGGTSAEPSVFNSGVFSMPASGSTSIVSSMRGWFLNLRIERQTAYFRSFSYQGRTQTATVQKHLSER